MEKTPFNPVLSSNLDIPLNESQIRKTKSTPRKTTKRRISPRVRRVLNRKASAIQFTRKVSRKAKTSWKRIKGDMQKRLSRLDAEQLKRVLAACGVAATAALVVIVLAKHVALIIALLAVLGVLVVLKIWIHLLGLGGI